MRSFGAVSRSALRSPFPLRGGRTATSWREVKATPSPTSTTSPKELDEPQTEARSLCRGRPRHRLRLRWRRAAAVIGGGRSPSVAPSGWGKAGKARARVPPGDGATPSVGDRNGTGRRARGRVDVRKGPRDLDHERPGGGDRADAQDPRAPLPVSIAPRRRGARCTRAVRRGSGDEPDGRRGDASRQAPL